MLQFQYIPLWVSDIDERDSAWARNVYRNKLANDASARCNHRISGGLNVIDREGDMGEARPISCRLLLVLLVVVLQYLKRRAIVAIAG